jgi:hypothetical protein
MKKILTSLFIGISLFGYAQQKFQLTNPEGILYTDGQTLNLTITENDLNPITEAFHLDILVHNLVAEGLRISSLCSGTVVDGMDAEVCFGEGCLSGPLPIAVPSFIPVGETDLYMFHLKTNGFFGLCTFTFEFAVDTDLIKIYANINMTPVGVKEQKNANVLLSAFPNPASVNSNVTISYTLAENNDNRLVIKNILGADIINIPLNAQEKSVSIDISSLKAGVYFYAIENRNKISIAKKLIVK